MDNESHVDDIKDVNEVIKNNDDNQENMPKRNKHIDNLIIAYGIIEEQKTFLSEYYEDKFNIDDIKEKFEEILRCIERKLKTECKHNYVSDTIDLDPDESVDIIYCNFCYSTFSKKPSLSFNERNKC
jgi:predicted nuclease with TOPRIM domain